jgi:hypothetical protein
MTIEMVFIWFYYDYINRHGNNVASRVLMFIVAIMNAGRGALSFFMLLIVCMGYSVVKYVAFISDYTHADPPSDQRCCVVESLE